MANTIQDILNNFQVELPQLSTNTLVAIREKITTIKLKKGDAFLSSGQISNRVGFLEKGVLRIFYLSNDKEHTSYFNVENRNPFVASFTSFLQQKPSHESIIALEDCTIHCLPYSELQKLYSTFSDMERLGRILAEQNYLMAIERIQDLQQQKADFKYDKFLSLYPGLMNRIPHHYISSYLGITPESLSRIRKKTN